MPPPTHPSRRDVLKLASLTALGLPLLGCASMSTPAAGPAAKTAPRPPGLKLGLATFTLAKLPVEGVIATLKPLEITAVSLYKTHAPWSDGTPAQCREAVQKFRDAGIAVTSTGMIDLTNDEPAMRRAFENVRAAGLTLMCGRQKPDALALTEKFVKEYDLKVAIHNHGPTEDFATGLDVWKAVQPFDRRIGLCLDTGHGFRAGENPAETIRIARERLYEVHLRDTMERGGTIKDPSPAVVGHGAVDIRAILTALLAVKYSGQVEFEYDKKEDDRVPGLAECVGYVRGMLTALA